MWAGIIHLFQELETLVRKLAVYLSIAQETVSPSQLMLMVHQSNATTQKNYKQNMFDREELIHQVRNALTITYASPIVASHSAGLKKVLKGPAIVTSSRDSSNNVKSPILN